MKKFKKTMCLILSLLIIVSMICVSFVSVSANAGDDIHRYNIKDVVNSDPSNQVKTKTYMFYMPQEWRNTFNDTYDGNSLDSCSAGIYWWEGSYNANDYQGELTDPWPGFAVTDTVAEDKNIFTAQVPADVTTIVWNNLVDGGPAQGTEQYVAAFQTGNVKCESYDDIEPDGYGFYPNGVSDFDGMIYVCNPKISVENEFTHKSTYKGIWMYYYGAGEYGIYPTRDEAETNDGILKGGEFPEYGFKLDTESVSLKVGEVEVITPNDNTATAIIEDPTIASITTDAKTGAVTVKGLKAGTTNIVFTLTKNGETETIKCPVTVTASTSEPTAQPTSEFDYELHSDGTAEITNYHGNSTSVEIPDKLEGNTVTSIGEYAFSYCESLESITIPDSVTSIGESAFYFCTSLERVIIGNGVTNIGGSAFYECTSLKDVTIGNSVTSIGDYAFYYCESLKDVTIPNSVTSIGGSAFYECTGLKDVTIPDSVTSIGENTFYECTSLKDVTIPDSVTSIGDYVFEECTSLESVIIGNGVTSIGEEAFYECTSLKDVTIGNSVASIGDYAFYYCESLRDVTIPNSVTGIGKKAFKYCTLLTNVTIPNSVTGIGWEAFYGTAWYDNKPNGVVYAGKVAYKYKGKCPATVNIKADTVGIAEGAFSYCLNPKKITIPNSVISIGENAFRFCANLQSITIGNGVTSIGFGAFSDCASLTCITIPRNVKNIDSYAFGYYYNYYTDYYEKIDNLIVAGYSGTGAQRYADNNDFKFTNLSDVQPTTPVYKTSISLKKSSGNVYVKKTLQIKATVKNSKGKTTYTSSNKKVAKVNSNGKITGVKKGTATITVTNNGVSKKFKVTVNNPKLNKSKLNLKKGKTFKLKITGKAGTQKYTSSKKNVATVSKKGIITAKKKGNATITVKTNGLKLKCKVKVK